MMIAASHSSSSRNDNNRELNSWFVNITLVALIKFARKYLSFQIT